ncbi:uncharacterized protein LOC132756963 [Ruditapes philippinarum]|uniref:uncharacterized protein LOC132756963 n=1 Tax=Ruditapes philippinarum TaxID=129788 RepID=UPI00295B22C2|nr:uncharacterized protein LOC132756963 [Ruditapes philippinarum]
MAFLINLETKIVSVETRLNKLDLLDHKVTQFDKDIKTLFTQIHDHKKATTDSLHGLDDRVERVEFISAQYQSRIESLEKENDDLKDQVTYLKSQSMRNNLIFGGFKEEEDENLDSVMRKFFVDKLKVAQSIVDSMKIERVHRLGQVKGNTTEPRKVVCRFAYFSDREIVRRQNKLLDHTDYFLHEQFPPEIVARRRKLLPKLKAAIKDKKKAWFVYDTLYIDGAPVKYE